MAAFQIQIIDAITGSPITGAVVYAVAGPAGGGVSVTTLVSTASGVTVPDGTTNVTISAAGYVIEDDAVTGARAIGLAPVPTPSATLSFTVTPNSDQTNANPPAPTSAGSVLTIQPAAGGAIETLSVFADGSALSVNTYAPGTYTITVTNPGFNTLTQQVVLPASLASSFLLALTKSTVAAAAVSASPAAALGSTVNTSSAATAAPPAPPSYEYIYPNSVDGKYFQAAQARMYIGNQFVDELNLCQWTGSQNRIPVYGYRSNKFDAVGRGRSLVQGQLAVNFISEGYMYILLQEFNKKINSKVAASLNTSLGGVPTALQTQINNVISARNRLLELGVAATPAMDAQLVSYAAISPQAAAYINSVKASGVLDASGQSLGSRTLKHRNAIYLDIPFDIVVKLEGAGRTVTKTLKNCFLGANDFSFAHDGKTLLDTYSFIARDVS
jgi:hypothetical protein